MPRRFPFVKQSKYPHLRPEDIAVWETFIDKYPDYFDSVDYDIRVGEGRIYPRALAGPYLTDMKLLTQMRIDVVAYRDDEVFIIELKPTVNTSALGQVFTYYELYKKEYPEVKKIHKMIIASAEMPDVRRVAETTGIIIILV